jgi:zinc protease
VRRYLNLILATTLMLALAAPAAARPPARQLYEYREHTLANGLRVITLEDFSCPIVAVQVWYHVGSKNEPRNRQGFAHMFEHMMFRGTDNLKAEEHSNLIRQAGGNCNAYTWFDNTTYVQTVPSDQLELALWLEAERMAFLKVDQENFDTERKVVEEELRMQLNSPYGTVPEKVLPVIFTRHPYAWTPGGQIDHLQAADVAELKRFWDLFYVPSNATLIIVGAVMHDEAHRLAEKYFGWMPRCPDPPRELPSEPPQTEPRSITLKEDKGPVPIAGVAFRAVPLRHPDEPAVGMMADILGGGESSRLYRRVVKEQKLATYVAAMALALEDDGLVIAGGVLVNPLGDTKEMLAAVRAQIDVMRDELVSERELTKAKNQMLRETVGNSLTVASKAQLLGEYAVIDGNLSEVNRSLERIRAVTREDIRRVAREYLSPERAVTVQVKPNLAGGLLGRLLGKTEEADDVSPETESADAGAARYPPVNRPVFERPDTLPTRPTITPPDTSYLPPAAERFTLDNGLKVIVVSNHEVPIVSLRLGLVCGAWTDPPELQGVASMASSMITRGTENYTADELAEVLDTLAIRLSGSADHDSASVQASCLTEQADRTMSLLAEVVRHPTFPQDELKLMADQMRTGLMVSMTQPEYIADRELRLRLWGDHPYARSDTPELADLERITPDDLRNWWNTYVRPDLAVLIVAGDVTAEDARQLARRYLADWQAEGPPPQLNEPSPPENKDTHIYLVDRPGSIQSQIRLGHVSINRHHPQWFRAAVLTQVFGGAFNSRLSEAVRIREGLTYGAYGGFDARRFAGRLIVFTSTKTRSTAEALQLVIDETRRMITEPVTKQETSVAVSYLTGSFAGDRETPQAVASDLWLIEQCGLPQDYNAQYLAGVAETTPTLLEQAAAALMHPDSLVIVVVGDAKKIKDHLEAIAPVTVVEMPSPIPKAQSSNQE